MGKSSFRKPWPVGFVYTIPLLFCVYICTSIDFDEFFSCFGFSFRPKTTDLIIENTYFYYRKWWNPGFLPFVIHFLGETTTSDGGRRVHPWFRVGFCWFSNFPARVESVLKKSGAKILNINEVTAMWKKSKNKTRYFFLLFTNAGRDNFKEVPEFCRPGFIPQMVSEGYIFPKCSKTFSRGNFSARFFLKPQVLIEIRRLRMFLWQFSTAWDTPCPSGLFRAGLQNSGTPLSGV